MHTEHTYKEEDMHDIMRPLKMDRLQLHGKVCIDLHNHKSGFTERIEGENLVTNLAQSQLNFGGFNYSIHSGDMFPIYTKCLGGLLLFNTPLTESEDNICLPASFEYVGHAGQYTDLSDPTSGSLNSVESEYSPTSCKTVWDFGTPQCNGQIRSLARTSYLAGHYGAGMTFKRPSNRPAIFGNNNGVYQNTIMVKFDNATNTLYLPEIHDSKMYIHKVHMPCNKYFLTDTGSGNSRYEIGVVGDITPLTTDNSRTGYDRFTDKFYQATTSGNSSGNATVTIMEINPDTGATTQRTLTCAGAQLANSVILINNGILYAKAYSNNKWYLINASTGATIAQTDIEISIADRIPPAARYNGGINIVNGSRYNVIVNEDGSTITALATTQAEQSSDTRETFHDTGYGFGWVRDAYYYYGGSSTGEYLYPTANGLGTIFNLPNAVEKTALMSMKVTYTLSVV